MCTQSSPVVSQREPVVVVLPRHRESAVHGEVAAVCLLGDNSSLAGVVEVEPQLTLLDEGIDRILRQFHEDTSIFIMCFFINKFKSD